MVKEEFTSRLVNSLLEEAKAGGGRGEENSDSNPDALNWVNRKALALTRLRGDIPVQPLCDE